MIIKIYGIPKPKQGDSSGIITTKTGKQFVHHYQKTEVKNEANNLRAQIIQQLQEDFVPFGKLIRINKIHFVFPLLKTMTKKQKEIIDNNGLIYKGTKPDLDNLQKALLDAMNGIVYKDDSQIVEINNIKKYYGVRPCIMVDIEEMEVQFLDLPMQFITKFLLLPEKIKQIILSKLIEEK